MRQTHIYGRAHTHTHTRTHTRTLSRQLLLTSRFPGLISLCRIPAECRYFSSEECPHTHPHTHHIFPTHTHTHTHTLVTTHTHTHTSYHTHTQSSYHTHTHTQKSPLYIQSTPLPVRVYHTSASSSKAS